MIQMSGSKRISRAEIGFRLGLGRRLRLEAGGKGALAGTRVVECRLRGRPVQVGGAVEPAILMKIAPASSAPRRRTTANAPSIWQRRT